MGSTDVAVLVGGTAAITVLAWSFSAQEVAHTASLRGGVREVDIEVNGGYSPGLVRVNRARP